MDYKVVSLGPKMVIGREIRTTNENWESAKVLGPFWGNFYHDQVFDSIPNKISNDVVGLYCEYELDHTKPYTLVAGSEVSSLEDIPDGLFGKEVPASDYAHFSISGKFPEAMMEVWKWIWQGNLNRTYTGDLEVYPEGWHPETNPDMEIYIAIGGV